jgi:hypothetical protein
MTGLGAVRVIAFATLVAAVFAAVMPEPTVRVCGVDMGTLKYFDIRTGPAGTTMERREYPSGSLLDTTTYAALQMPARLRSIWGEGVAFTAAMQARHVWVNGEPNTQAFWDVDAGDVRWRFESTINSLPVSYMFRTSSCIDDWLLP